MGLVLMFPARGQENIKHFQAIAEKSKNFDQIPGGPRADREAASNVSTILQRAFFVSPTGDDGSDGSERAPFKTLQKAQDAMRTGSVKTVYLRAGTYHLSKALILGPIDSGQMWLNYPGEKPVISGGEAVTGFREEASSGHYSAPIAFNPGLDVTVKGVRQRAAQTGAWKPDEVLHETGFFFLDQGPDLSSTFKFRGTDLAPVDWTPGIFAETFLPMRYGSRINRVSGIDFASKIVTLSASTGVGALTNGSTYRLLGNPRWIKNRGEFGYDDVRKQLILYPHDPSSLTAVVVAKLSTLFHIENAYNIDIIGLTLSDTVYNNGARNKAALIVNRAFNVRVGGSYFKNVGRAIEIFGGAGHRIAGNEIAYVESGISVEDGLGSGVPNDIRIYSNNIHDTALTGDKGGGAVTIAQGGTNVRIAHNHIQDVGRAGINWWTDGRPTVNNFVIEFNRVIRAQRATGDNAAIYGFVNHSTHDHNSVIRHNWIEDTGGITNYNYWKPADSRLYQWVYNGLTHGIYLDDSVSGVAVEGNFVKGGSAGIMVHGGRNNVVTNNFSIVRGVGPIIAAFYLADSRKGGQEITPTANTYSRNISFSPIVTTKSHIEGTAYAMNADFNLIFNMAKRAGADAKSLAADPRFKDPAGGDYSLLPSSPAFALGIKELLWKRMGLQGFSPGDIYPKFWGGSSLDTNNIPAGPFNAILQMNLPH
jgi:parallel beta-helix repeat protein